MMLFLILGVFFVGASIFLKLYSQVGSICNSTLKAMGNLVLKKTARFASKLCSIAAILCFLMCIAAR